MAQAALTKGRGESGRIEPLQRLESAQSNLLHTFQLVGGSGRDATVLGI
ncbi:hypothetical protein [Chroococcidiopsis cubana]|nr:hypothetical protein [Chroococcidiopsis cubana]